MAFDRRNRNLPLLQSVNPTFDSPTFNQATFDLTSNCYWWDQHGRCVWSLVIWATNNWFRTGPSREMFWPDRDTAFYATQLNATCFFPKNNALVHQRFSAAFESEESPTLRSARFKVRTRRSQQTSGVVLFTKRTWSVFRPLCFSLVWGN